ncbi:MAG TPA: enolase C-terminal domain-like protein [Candidatus Baltobacteraceae bacterium]|nr:enolase C-terminal domain-like protein [Candidatus Baltobacteraceae bacterium]
MSVAVARQGHGCPVAGLDVSVYRVPTDGGAESDGTARWDATTMVLVEIHAAGKTGMGYTYADEATALVVERELRAVLEGADALETARRYHELQTAVRNMGRDGIAAMAISAVDIALWDLRGKIFGVPVYALIGAARDSAPVYGSGGFTSYGADRLRRQLRAWVDAGIPRVKMKIGSDPAADIPRVAEARRAIGDRTELFVDANGAYSRKQAMRFADELARLGVTWFEEPVYHQDFEGLSQVRERAPAGMDIAAGEYGYEPAHFWRMLEAKTVDCLQADATRCGGFSGLLAVDGLCQSAMLPLSTHCGPHVQLHAALGCKMLRHMEYFYDHARIERMFFDGASEPIDGSLYPDPSRPGIGLQLRRADARRYQL